MNLTLVFLLPLPIVLTFVLLLLLGETRDRSHNVSRIADDGRERRRSQARSSSNPTLHRAHLSGEPPREQGGQSVA
jgi:hypothetical protein